MRSYCRVPATPLLHVSLIFVSAKMKFAIALLVLVPFIVAAETEEKRQFDLLNIASSKPLNY